jgi:predicted Abi (CAAX) family protease
LLSFLVIRTFGGVSIPTHQDWLIVLIALLLFGGIIYLGRETARIAMPINAPGFFKWQPDLSPWYRQLLLLLRLLFVPALVQEYVFRVLLIPYPKPWIPEAVWWSWALLALGLFVLFQVIYAKWFKSSFTPTLTHPTFLVLIVYRLTASLWTITVLHWVAVSIWWLLLGGRSYFVSQKGELVGL